jgi:hypothetical protein
MMSTAEEGKAAMFGDNPTRRSPRSGDGAAIRPGEPKRVQPSRNTDRRRCGQTGGPACGSCRGQAAAVPQTVVPAISQPRREQQRPEGWRPGQRDNAAAAATALVSS